MNGEGATKMKHLVIVDKMDNLEKVITDGLDKLIGQIKGNHIDRPNKEAPKPVPSLEDFLQTGADYIGRIEKIFVEKLVEIRELLF